MRGRAEQVLSAQIFLTIPAFLAATIVFRSWWSVVLIPAVWILPAMWGASMDTMDERDRAKMLHVHPSTWDAYFDVPRRGWEWSDR